MAVKTFCQEGQFVVYNDFAKVTGSFNADLFMEILEFWNTSFTVHGIFCDSGILARILLKVVVLKLIIKSKAGQFLSKSVRL